MGRALSAARQAAAEAATVPQPLRVSALRLQWCAAHADSCRSARHGAPQGSSRRVIDIGRSCRHGEPARVFAPHRGEFAGLPLGLPFFNRPSGAGLSLIFACLPVAENPQVIPRRRQSRVRPVLRSRVARLRLAVCHFAVCHRGGMDDDPHRQPLAVDQGVDFAALHLLAGVVTHLVVHLDFL